MAEITAEELAYVRRLRDDFRYFCRNCIKIYDKQGNLVPLILNTAQEFLFASIWGMWLELGFVRLIGVKGRQQGFSTLIQALFLWMAIFHSGMRVSVLAHNKDSTDALFEKTEIMYRYCPDDIKPGQIAANAKQLKFDNDSQYTLSTAGAKETGRGDNAQLQHFSEEAFFENPGIVKASIGRIVSILAGTMRIRESTGNGQNDFYKDVTKAQKGEGKFRVVFVPWFWQSEYRAQPAPDFVRTEYEQKIADEYGLDDWQLQWRRDTIVELDTEGYPGEKKFKQEYPNTLAEAFQTSEDSFFDPEVVSRARKTKIESPNYLPLIMGVDPGRNRDRTVITLRRGRKVLKQIVYEKMDTMRLAAIIIELIQSEKVDRVFIDYGMGHGTIDRLRELKWGKYITPVDFGSGADNKLRFLNKRAEMFFKVNEWLTDKGGCSLPDDDDLAMDMAALPMFKEASTGIISFVSKDEIRKKIGRSPDKLDSLALTFAYEVRSESAKEHIEQTRTQVQEQRLPSSLSARRRVQSLTRHGNRDGTNPYMR